MSRDQSKVVSPMGEMAYTSRPVIINPEKAYQGLPGQTYRSNYPLWLLGTAALGNTALAATGVALAVPIVLQQSDVVNSISYVTATTAAGTPTHQYVALYDNAATPNLLATSGDLTSTARAANTLYTISLQTNSPSSSSPVTIMTTDRYWVSISFTATTVPTLLGGTAFNVADTASLLGSTVLGQTHGSALAGVAPASIASPTTATTCPLVIVT